MVLKNSFPITERLGLTINTSCCCAIRAKAPVGRVPTNPSLKAGVSDCLIVRLSSRRSLNWALALTVPDLQSVGQQTCSDYLLSIPYRRDRALHPAYRREYLSWFYPPEPMVRHIPLGVDDALIPVVRRIRLCRRDGDGGVDKLSYRLEPARSNVILGLRIYCGIPHRYSFEQSGLYTCRTVYECSGSNHRCRTALGMSSAGGITPLHPRY